PPPSSTSPPPPPSSTSRSPPPPSNSTRSPPPPSSTSRSPPPPPPASSTSSPSPSSGVSTGLVVGVAIGGVVLLALLVIVLLTCKKKRRRDHRREDYYNPPPSGPKNGNYGGQQQWQQQQGPAPGDHVVMMIPKPSPPPSLGSHPPGPSPHYMSSSGGSNYSGSENPLLPVTPGVSLGLSQSTFTYEELSMATDGFSDANILGQGGFGYVHRGVLPNGKEVAVKSLKAGSGQGEREFRAEVEIISRVHHKHLVSLVGYCITGTQRMLVYDFVANNTLEFHLHEKGRPTMDWPSRLRIALGSAKGLAYLHEDCHPKIIHRDIKAANILIDFNFEAKVADFGLAKNTSDINTHVSTRVMGTFGYLAPEYASSGKLTEKSDVFSYGVVLLELITGRRPVNTTNTYMDDSLVDWARPVLTQALEEGNYDALVDPKLQKNYDHNEMGRMVACAAACVRHSARRRPKMSQVVRALEGNASLSDLNEGIKPGHSTVYSSYGSTDYDNNQYNEDMKKFRKMALASQEYSSGGYSTGMSSSDGQTTREMEMTNKKGDGGDNVHHHQQY
uniref:non-specific serine/threonine protein kinase n=1 Tax=Kalanchoe fedtschenkoi TaxID=63787 RepID=A0A7N0TZ35_KALFE